MSPEQNYPAVRFVVQYGLWLSIVVGLAPLFVAVVAILSGWGGGAALILALSAPLLFLVMKAFAELVAIISDMLLPK